VSLKVISLLQVFSSAVFRICGALRGPSASAELLVIIQRGHTQTHKVTDATDHPTYA